MDSAQDCNFAPKSGNWSRSEKKSEIKSPVLMYLKFIYYLGLKNQVFCYNPGHWSHFCIGTSHCACTCLYSGMRVYISLRNKKNRYVLPLDFCFRYTQSQCYSIRYKNLIKTRHNNVYSDSVMPEPGGPGGPLAPQYLADQLTPFQPGRADYPHLHCKWLQTNDR